MSFITNKPDAPRHIYVLNKLGKGAGLLVGLFENEVYVPNLWKSLETVLQCHSKQCADKTMLSRDEILTLFGKGVGHTAAHELGHQGPRAFTIDVACVNCYDNENSFRLAHFYGGLPQVGAPAVPLYWSEYAKEIMDRVLPRK